MSIENSQNQIASACDEIKSLLLFKNKNYGDSVLNPARIMSKASTVEQLLVRIDDKLNRISKGAGLLATDEDVVKDLCGYFILLKIALDNERGSFQWVDGPEPELDTEPGSDWNFKTQTTPFSAHLDHVTPDGIQGPSGMVGPTGIQVMFPEKLKGDGHPYVVDN